jgi:hypothetical protein
VSSLANQKLENFVTEATLGLLFDPLRHLRADALRCSLNAHSNYTTNRTTQKGQVRIFLMSAPNCLKILPAFSFDVLSAGCGNVISFSSMPMEAWFAES